jgi:Dolichyl-phosphate-mannose-protein mannosyltransferase
MRLEKIDLLLLLLCIGACIVLYNPIIPKDYYGYDEADHMFAVSKGIYANYIDANTIPFRTFLRIGIQQGLQDQNRSSLSEYIRASDDITFYRHYHGPLYFYALTVSQYLFGSSEYTARWTSLLFLLVSIFAVYMGCFSLSKENPRVAAVIASVLLMCSSANIITTVEITAHGLYTLTAITTLIFMAKLLQTNDLRYWYCSIIAMAISFAVIEYAPVLLLTFAICIFIERRRIFANWAGQEYKRLVIISVALFIGVIFIIWPGAWLKLSLIKNYIFFAYVILAREGEFGTRDFWEVWWQRFSEFPLIYILIIPVIFLAALHIKRHIIYLPFLLYSIFMIAITFRNTAPSLHYISSLFPPLFILSGLIAGKYLENSKNLVKISFSVLVAVVFVTHMWLYLIKDRSKAELYTPLKNLVDYVRSHNDHDKKVLVDRRLLPTLHYYFPYREFDSYRDKSSSLRAIRRELANASYDGLIYMGKYDQELEEFLRRSVNIQPETITKHPSLDRQIKYYKIGPIQP